MSIDPSTNSNVAQLIDANLDRAREGLRVVEDWCRFGLNQKELVVTLKGWRQQLGLHHRDIYKQARDTSKDQGIGLCHPAQENRNSPERVIAANCSRVQEALRVLEEFTRSCDPDLATSASSIRYGLYDLESSVLNFTLKTKRRQKLKNCKVCLITSSQANLSKTIEESIKAGVGMIQYRCKNGTDSEKLIQAKELAAICKSQEVLFIINDRLDLALAVEADGVHLGQDDFSTDIARKLLGSEKLIGRSTHCLKQLKDAESEGCDYLGVGPIYPTKTKPEESTCGIGFVKEASEVSELPWFAIGGINNSNLDKVILAGANRIAVVGAIMDASDPLEASLELLQKIP